MGIHHPEHKPYRYYTTLKRVDKAIQMFYGMVRGITIVVKGTRVSKKIVFYKNSIKQLVKVSHSYAKAFSKELPFKIFGIHSVNFLNLA